MTSPLIGGGLWWFQWPVPSGTFYVVVLRAQRKCASDFSFCYIIIILYILFVLPSSGAVPAQNTTNGQLLVMEKSPEPVAAAGGGGGGGGSRASGLCHWTPFVSRAFLCKYTLIMMTPPLHRTSDIVYPSTGAFLPQITTKGTRNVLGEGRDPSAAAADGGDGGGDAGAGGTVSGS
ncbi:uncharacterized protein BO87DRAFT_420092 [Aspergillus neoniger CBS 115656]|uniref:Uncharacterized protein n=1 Tax=Aspergillus neoniger (strain CBS 115656) TaxID=1448310 RepID=A0A318Y369_ASPNB|nr:hypothetical protein BO87DRAFT_420092 [Aspergillus neoniger CBS 115656]PYH28786.1 hypothetical protein BO87DRAFT_420092 [Aspergillus neoniger CBS 115656]